MSSRDLSMDKLESKFPRRRKHKQTDDGKRKFSAWLGVAALPIAFVATLSAQELAASQDSSLHKVQSINVDLGVNLEVLDWEAPDDL